MDLYDEALTRFQRLFTEAQKTDLRESAAMTLATCSADGRPTVRTMTVRHFDRRGFVFFTNNRSRKAEQLMDNPHAALCFFCQPLWEQVTVEGEVEMVEGEEVQRWWSVRPREKQFAAWACKQSAPLESLDVLKARLAEFHAKYADTRVPQPPTWSGYRLKPERIEFWKTGWRNLHERVCYERNGDVWNKLLLHP